MVQSILPQFPIWDLHTHIAYAPSETPQDRMRYLVEEARKMGIERVCTYMGMNFIREPSPEELRMQNEQVARAIEPFPDRAFGFVYLNPQHVDASLKELDRWVANGPMTGVKLWVAVRCSDPRLDPIIRRAAELDAVIFQHTYLKVGGDPPRPGGANLPGESTPRDMAELAARHPDIPMIMGHTGSDWELGIRAIRKHENVSIGIGGYDPTAGVTEMAMRELGPDRIIFASDASGRSYGSQLAKVTGADLSTENLRKMLAGNLYRLMKPILDRKGRDIRPGK